MCIAQQENKTLAKPTEIKAVKTIWKLNSSFIQTQDGVVQIVTVCDTNSLNLLNNLNLITKFNYDNCYIYSMGLTILGVVDTRKFFTNLSKTIYQFDNLLVGTESK